MERAFDTFHVLTFDVTGVLGQLPQSALVE